MLQKSIMDSKPELKWMPLDELYIPKRYQRALENRKSLENIEHIKQNFNWGEFGTLLISKLKGSNDKYAVIDGQHRLRAAELRDDIEQVPCVIIAARELHEQANTFLNVNGHRTALTTLQFHRAALVAKEPIALEVQRICDEAQVVVPTYFIVGSKIQPKVFQHVGTLRQIIKADDYTTEVGDRFVWAIKCLVAAYAKKNVLYSPLVRALAFWKATYPATKKEEMIQVLKSIDMNTLYIDVRSTKNAHDGKARWKGYFAFLEQRYEQMYGKNKLKAVA